MFGVWFSWLVGCGLIDWFISFVGWVVSRFVGQFGLLHARSLGRSVGRWDGFD